MRLFPAGSALALVDNTSNFSMRFSSSVLLNCNLLKPERTNSYQLTRSQGLKVDLRYLSERAKKKGCRGEVQRGARASAPLRAS